jgi:hypothetical protein
VSKIDQKNQVIGKGRAQAEALARDFSFESPILPIEINYINRLHYDQSRKKNERYPDMLSIKYATKFKRALF